MPHCENTVCNKQLAPEEVKESREGLLLCSECVKVTPLHTNQDSRILNRQLDYAFGYTKKKGIQAYVRLGGVKLSLEVSQKEITSIFGPEAL
jgi:hypothetical protein